jgi:putative SOS response-associated peptidase YedK
MCGRFALNENPRKLAEHFCLRQALMELLSIELSTINPC